MKMTLSKTIAGFAAAALLAMSTAVQAQTPAPVAPMKGGMMMKAVKAPLLDINTASKASLQALKGIGDKRADDIIKGRPYKGKDDLVSKKILTQGVYDGIKDKIVAKQK